MRNISCSLTADQVLDRTKTVTRRLGWRNLKPGTVLRVVRKAMGLKKGEHPEQLAVVRVVCVNRERLNEVCINPRYGRKEIAREGFPQLAPDQFVMMFCRHMKCDERQWVTRIEWEYVEEL